MEEHLQNPTDPSLHLPEAILHLEKRLGEPVKVHNDDKIRRQKLREQKQQQNKKKHCKEAEEKQATEAGESLELRAALAKLSVEDAVLSPATREHCEIRKVRTADLPPLEHVFAEGLYFTLTDVVLLPCIYHYLVMTTALSFITSMTPRLELPPVITSALLIFKKILELNQHERLLAAIDLPI